mmetsp:Transcript_7671/g.14291  ORF Transcript_7671/g.14291 Transcript_7671/m.14291 type:complete len:236 (-) Transcript_7671:491-1198(-)
MQHELVLPHQLRRNRVRRQKRQRRKAENRNAQRRWVFLEVFRRVHNHPKYLLGALHLRADLEEDRRVVVERRADGLDQDGPEHYGPLDVVFRLLVALLLQLLLQNHDSIELLEQQFQNVGNQRVQVGPLVNQQHRGHLAHVLARDQHVNLVHARLVRALSTRVEDPGDELENLLHRLGVLAHSPRCICNVPAQSHHDVLDVVDGVLPAALDDPGQQRPEEGGHLRRELHQASDEV